MEKEEKLDIIEKNIEDDEKNIEKNTKIDKKTIIIYIIIGIILFTILWAVFMILLFGLILCILLIKSDIKVKNSFASSKRYGLIHVFAILISNWFYVFYRIYRKIRWGY